MQANSDCNGMVRLEKFQNLGCFNDGKPRAISGAPIRFIPPATTIEKCYQRALENGNSHFAVQSKILCYTHPNAGNTYFRYGRSTGCRNGRGGMSKMNVYRLVRDGNIPFIIISNMLHLTVYIRVK